MAVRNIGRLFMDDNVFVAVNTNIKEAVSVNKSRKTS